MYVNRFASGSKVWGKAYFVPSEVVVRPLSKRESVCCSIYFRMVYHAAMRFMVVL